MELNLPAAILISIPPSWRIGSRNHWSRYCRITAGHAATGEKPCVAADVTSRLTALAGILTLVISGDHDMIAPPSLGCAIAAGIPEACLSKLPGRTVSRP